MKRIFCSLFLFAVAAFDVIDFDSSTEMLSISDDNSFMLALDLTAAALTAVTVSIKK